MVAARPCPPARVVALPSRRLPPRHLVPLQTAPQSPTRMGFSTQLDVALTLRTVLMALHKPPMASTIALAFVMHSQCVPVSRIALASAITRKGSQHTLQEVQG